MRHWNETEQCLIEESRRIAQQRKRLQRILSGLGVFAVWLIALSFIFSWLQWNRANQQCETKMKVKSSQ